MISLLLITIIAILWAVLDTLAHHYSVSIFNKLDERFWNQEISWKYTGFIPFTHYRLDAWHICKSLIVICVALAAIFHSPVALIGYTFPWWMELGLYGIIYNQVFNLFYNKLLLR